MYKGYKTSAILILTPLILSAFTHLFNPVGFPCVNFDEAVGMRRAMHFLAGLGPQDPSSRFDHSQASTSSYDHPHFGQLFLAGIFKIIGYPSSLNPSSSIQSIEMLYVIPRALMGLLAVLDTFLIYKIVERRYNTKTGAFIASTLFAVMPLTWLYRWILLDSILMPFVLSSILLTLYLQKNNKEATVSDNIDSSIGIKNPRIISTLAKNKEITLTLMSGILLGLAIYTKVPAITAIPVVGFLIFANTRRWKMLGWWFVPVILIPLLWPAYALSVGQFDEWVDGVLWQATEREVGSGAGSSHTISSELRTIFYMDPILISLSLAGILFAALRRNYFILLWVIPFFILSYVIHWVYYFHFILLLPVFCIASALLIIGVRDIFMKKNNVYKKIIPFAVISAIGLFGLTTTVLLILSNFSLPYFAVASFIVQHSNDNFVTKTNNVTNNPVDDTTIISSPAFTWIFSYVFGNDHVLSTRASQDLTTQKVLLVIDPNYKFILSGSEIEDKAQVASLLNLYNKTAPMVTFQPPIIENNPLRPNIRSCYLEQIQVRTNY
jgi:4-amino-4-deoxy-L-arabinose transferase-like glycosyltransferase